MPKICYVERKFSQRSVEVIDQANEIIEDYVAQGFVLTLRQLYYQFVSRDLIANTQREYKRIGSIINDARLAGLVDWNAIEDRTRSLESLAHWDGPEEILHAISNQFRLDKWEFQPCRVEVWIEKEALAGVFEGVCQEMDVPFLSCRGYGSQSVMWRAAQRLRKYEREQSTLILHFGDHDPSGMDMTRDIVDRLNTFGSRVEVRRIALNMDQIEEHNPPPNPAKVTDSRSDGYMLRYGRSSWELDALEPAMLSSLARTEILKVRDESSWAEKTEEEEGVCRNLGEVADNWHAVVEDWGS